MAAASLNGLLRDRLIRHGVLLSRYENSLVNHVVGFLNDDVLPNLLARIQARLDSIKSRGFDLGPATTARLQAIAANIQDIIASGRAELEARTTAGLVDLADQESQYSTNLLNTATPVNVTFDAPAPDLLAALVSEQPIGGTLLSGWFDSMEANTAAAVMRTIRSGIATGDTTDAIVRALRGTAANRYNDGVLQGTRRSVEALVRTATAHVANQAHMAVYKENSDLLNGVQWSSTLDARTCEECMDLDGTVYDDLNDGERPPAHISCRCAVLPVIKSYRQLGIPADELPESTRASMDGQVPESMTYGDWLKDQPADVQDEALGPRRAELFRGGGLDIHGFVNDKGRILNLDELRKAEPDAFTAIGQGRGFEFYSPNEEENLSFATALKRLDSPEQAQFVKISQDVDRQLGLSGATANVVGDWSDGAENSLMTTFNNVSSLDDVRYDMAIKGDIANQKAVIPFLVTTNGPDSIYRFAMTGPLDTIRTQLNDSGLQFRTLIPEQGGAKVVIFDPGTTMLDVVDKAAEKYGFEVEQIQGKGEFLGGETRQEGHDAYAKVIADYENTHQKRYSRP